jgi:hypothetical protein
MVGGYCDTATGVHHGLFTDGKSTRTVDIPGTDTTSSTASTIPE